MKVSGIQEAIDELNKRYEEKKKAGEILDYEISLDTGNEIIVKYKPVFKIEKINTEFKYNIKEEKE